MATFCLTMATLPASLLIETLDPPDNFPASSPSSTSRSGSGNVDGDESGARSSTQFGRNERNPRQKQESSGRRIVEECHQGDYAMCVFVYFSICVALIVFDSVEGNFPIHLYAHAHTHTHTHTHTPHTHTTHTHTHTHTHTYTHTCTHTRMHTHTCMHACTHTDMQTGPSETSRQVDRQ